MNRNSWNIFFLVVVCITFLILIFWTILSGQYDLRQRVRFDGNSISTSLLNN
jgi:nitrogen fixation-related uncharacterized protein